MTSATAETYAPCAFGVHVCGVSANGEEPVTVANFPTRGDASARSLWGAARERFAASAGEPDDLIVDLCVGPHDLVDGFPMTRQMLEPVRRFIAERDTAPNP